MNRNQRATRNNAAKPFVSGGVISNFTGTTPTTLGTPTPQANVSQLNDLSVLNRGFHNSNSDNFIQLLNHNFSNVFNIQSYQRLSTSVASG